MYRGLEHARFMKYVIMQITRVMIVKLSNKNANLPIV